MPTYRTTDPNIDPEAYRELRERIYRTSLKVWWSREYGYLSVLDPFSGEVLDVANEDALKWMKWRAFEEKGRRRSRVISRGSR